MSAESVHFRKLTSSEAQNCVYQKTRRIDSPVLKDFFFLICQLPRGKSHRPMMISLECSNIIIEHSERLHSMQLASLTCRLLPKNALIVEVPLHLMLLNTEKKHFWKCTAWPDSHTGAGWRRMFVNVTSFWQHERLWLSWMPPHKIDPRYSAWDSMKCKFTNLSMILFNVCVKV